MASRSHLRGWRARLLLLEGTTSSNWDDGWMDRFRSTSGATYNCQLRGKLIALKWRNDSGPMSSNSTQFDEDNEIITVRPKDLEPWRFRRSGVSYRPLD
jgi:hypothetical protein